MPDTVLTGVGKRVTPPIDISNSKSSASLGFLLLSVLIANC